ncbi:MAG TPA: right-handed parallel beta-helix repeat-containing protein, partial [Isosphaeraceae bacterium]|nr:right-handed parallel beta-helix repeat-containing protein [Isosphaeraceae bacterium]
MRLLRTVPSPRRTRVRRSDRVPFLELVEPRLLLASFTVTSAADDPSGPTPGIVTLRDAINEVNNDTTDVVGNPDVIKFAISGTPTISLAANLPALTAPVFIDGASQHGYSGTPLIQIDGHGVQGSGLTLSPGSNGSTIAGLDIYGFSQGAGLLIQSNNNVIESSYLGTSDDGVIMSSAYYNCFTDCTFSGNSGDGVYMSTANYNTFTGCNFTRNSFAGVYMSSAYNNTFTDCTFSRNTGYVGWGYGVYMSNAYNNCFTGCTFSTNWVVGVYMSNADSNTFTGCNFKGNLFAGVEMSSAYYNSFTDCTFSGNSVDGVYMSSADSNTNTFTGCNFTGNLFAGVEMSSAYNNTFTDDCTFSGNSVDGVYMSSADSNTFTGCTIADNNNAGILINTMSEDNVIDENHIVGTPSNGSSTQQAGILINDSINNTIGGTTAGSTTPANVIGGNNVGIEITGFNSNLTGGNLIEGNYIGVKEDGSAIGNLYGIWIDDVPFNTIGGTDKGAGNTISDNEWAGVYIFGPDATGNLLEGNSILGRNNKGTKTSPTNPLPIGVFIQNSSSNTIGGAGAGNTIYGNNVGVYIVGTGGASTNNQVLGNFIGLSANGASRPGNVLYGVILVNAPNNNVPQSGRSANKIVDSGIANFREYSGPIAPTTQSSSGSGSKAKKPAHHSNHVAHQSP